ncbi:Rv3654c family TadE-like protein [Corynebacterium liangguodongii]|uniref:TadE-like protein n=1 Tax=Corynebacterium liangguodongii TaxID=2079535 RepID=A0A2S0WC24_9CORY|nr:Rv3654c family TadE-like protein [Corynebacterium liangguodongii]AWB83232.1 TadE-like protein [Corynebacterium liangguodongii]PWB98671.1 TadE-like protein [Corynebacterium liangguodongii]
MTRREALRGEGGYATVFSAGLIASLMGLLAVVVTLGAHVANAHRAQVAADLAAVGAAQALYAGAEPCRWAEETARANAARLDACETVDGDVVVTARIGTVAARARAGPL